MGPLVPILIFASVLTAILIGKSAEAKPDGKTQVSEFNAWDSLIQKYSSRSGVPWKWVKAIMIIESDLGRAPSVKRGLLSPDDVNGSKSSDGKSWGLMQVTLPTARQFESSVTEAGLNDPEISVRIGCKYIAYLYKLKNKDREAVVRSYNGGPGYLKTARGISDTPGYYVKFLRALAQVETDTQV